MLNILMEKESCNNVNLLDNFARSQVKVLFYDSEQLLLGLVRSAVVEYGDGKWFSHTNSVCNLENNKIHFSN